MRSTHRLLCIAIEQSEARHLMVAEVAAGVVAGVVGVEAVAGVAPTLQCTANPLRLWVACEFC